MVHLACPVSEGDSYNRIGYSVTATQSLETKEETSLAS